MPAEILSWLRKKIYLKKILAMLPCHTQDNFHFSPSTHIYNQDDNDESILSLFWGFQEYILQTKAMVNKWEVMVYILLI